MVLCDREILLALQCKQLIIDPMPPPERIAPSAVDLTLADEFKQWKKRKSGRKLQIDPSLPDFNFSEIAVDGLEHVPRESDGGVILKPDAFILSSTAERVTLPKISRLAARIEGRSTMARLGVEIHMTAPTIHVGFEGTITLEIKNNGPLEIILRPGLVFCQLVVEHVFGTPEGVLESTFQGQTSVEGKLNR